MANEQSHLKVSTSNGVTVVEFVASKILDELSISEIRDELTKLASQPETTKLLLSFRNVEHLSSAALGVLITLNKQVAERKAKLRLSDITPQIFEVFKITRLNKLFDIHDTTEKALVGF